MPETDTEQELCKNCGFCCDSTLFPHATIEAGDVLPPGLPEVYEEGNPCFKLPCPYFNGLCTVYHEGRPAVCDTYKCTLLENFIEGEVCFEEATQLVAKIKDQKARINQLLLAYPGETLMERYKEFQRQNSALKDTAEFRLQNKDLLMEWVLFNTRLKRFSTD